VVKLPLGKEKKSTIKPTVKSYRCFFRSFTVRFYDINYFTISYLMIIRHCIYEERDEISFLGMKLV
jgi:hypothetical protein